jgi:hypothetical protein
VQIWGLWQDPTGNVYAAVISDKTVKKISSSGNVSVVYQSKDNWYPLQGIFDKENRLWILEGSDKNEVRVTEAGEPTPESASAGKSQKLPVLLIITGVLILSFAVLYLKFKNPNRKL